VHACEWGRRGQSYNSATVGCGCNDPCGGMRPLACFTCDGTGLETGLHGHDGSARGLGTWRLWSHAKQLLSACTSTAPCSVHSAYMTVCRHLAHGTPVPAASTNIRLPKKLASSCLHTVTCACRTQHPDITTTYCIQVPNRKAFRQCSESGARSLACNSLRGCMVEPARACIT
jgi:hypothetical protein